jgi:hypothetical protein
MTLEAELAKELYRTLTEGAEYLAAAIPQASAEQLTAALKNPALNESHLQMMLRRRDLPAEIVKGICRLPLVESSHNLKAALARHPNIPAAQLLALLPHLYLFELLNICILPDTSPDQKIAAERAIIQRLPATPLGNRLTLARRGTAALLEALVKEADARILALCLSNPQLKEGTLYQFLRGGKATAETISLVARAPRWHSRPNIKEAILTNPKTPLIWFTLWLPGMKSVDLRRLLASNRLTQAQRKAVEERLKG